MPGISKWRVTNHVLLNGLRDEKIKAGICIDCDNPRGEGGTTTRCRSCAKITTDRSKKWHAAHKKPPTSSQV
jgi:hypothetical protein